MNFRVGPGPSPESDIDIAQCGARPSLSSANVQLYETDIALDLAFA